MGRREVQEVKIIAFDLGSTWACAWHIESGLAWNHYDENPDRAKPKLRLERPAVLGSFAERLGTSLEPYDLVVHSKPFARGEAATRLLAGMAGILEAAAHNAGCAILMVTDSEIKKWATGSGKADKPAMIEAAHQMGYTGDNEHEADAFCLLRYAEATITARKS
jgi:hypothetical protein